VYFEKTNYNKAIECFDKALVIYRKFSDAQFYKSICLYEMNKRTEALALLEDAYTNFKEGYIMNEDNINYEYYPYQLRKAYISNRLKWAREQAAKK
jgi:tetratricopeptide (TPR) repeat protein